MMMFEMWVRHWYRAGAGLITATQRCRNGTAIGVALLVLVGVAALPTPASAVVVRPQGVECTDEFPCSDSLKRRVDFWVYVFSRWDRRDMILHDSDTPWRVYDVIGWQDSCDDKRVKKARKRLKANLNALGDQLAAGKPVSSRSQKKLAALFDQPTARKVRAAAKSIRCQPGVKDQYYKALGQYQHYRPMVLSIIRDMQMSEELQYLPFVESSFNATAYSKAGAAGMWQIMPATARTLGMQIDATIDERLDPAAATRGAMRYFQNSQKKLLEVAREKDPSISQTELGPFMVTSYNYGVTGMRRAIREIGTDFDRVLDKYKSKRFQVAVKNFYASFLAARHIAKQPEAYFSSLPKADTRQPVVYVLPHDTSIERIKSQFNLDEDTLKPLNPALTRFVWHNWRLIPAGYQLKLPPREGQWVNAIARLEALAPEQQLTENLVYRVRRGDTACAIARAFRVGCKELIAANKLGRRATIHVGQRLDIPGRFRKMTAAEIAASKARKQSKTAAAKPIRVEELLEDNGQYRVKRGDTACEVASRFDVACRELISLNQLGRGGRIVVGQPLRIPGVTPSKNVARAKKGAATTSYTVKRGDTACEIAEAFDVPCSQLVKVNRLGKRARIKPGQTLTIPGTERAEIASEVNETPPEVPADLAALLDTLPELVLSSAKGRYILTAMAEETLGHYADWAGSVSPSALARLNSLRSPASLRPGKRVKLPKMSAAQAEKFSQQRAEYHQVLLESFKERFSVVGEKRHIAEKGDSLWEIAREQEAPLWLVYRLNPDLMQGGLKPGQSIRLPALKQRG